MAMRLAFFFLVFTALLSFFGMNVLTILRESRLFDYRAAERRRRREDETMAKRGAGGPLARYKFKLSATLKNSAFDAGPDGLLRLKALFGALGCAAGLLAGNPPLAAVLTVGCFWLPDAYFRLASARFSKEIDEAVETAISVVTNSYLQSEDIKSAILENIAGIERPLRDIFREFLAETSFVDASVANALRRMKLKVDNSFFGDWCDILIQCQDDRELKFALPSVVSKLSGAKRIQVELDVAMLDIYKEFLMVVAIIVLNVPLMFLINVEWADILFHTPPGKAAVALCFAVIFAASAYVVSVNKPLTRL